MRKDFSNSKAVALSLGLPLSTLGLITNPQPYRNYAGVNIREVPKESIKSEKSVLGRNVGYKG